MSESEGRPRNIGERLQGLSRTLAALGRTRLELLGVEIREEEFRLVQLLIQTAVFLFLSFMAMVILTFALVLAFLDHALYVLLGLFVVYLSGALWAARLMRRRFLNRTMPFEASVNELKKDLECLSPKN